MMFQLGSKLSAFLSCRRLALARGTVTAGLTAVSHPNVLDSGDPETVQIFTSIHEEDVFSVCHGTIGSARQVQIQIFFIHVLVFPPDPLGWRVGRKLFIVSGCNSLLL